MGSEHTAQPSQPSWIPELQQPPFAFQYTTAHSHTRYQLCLETLSWCALAWGRAGNKGRDLWLLAMFMLCLPMGSRTASRTCARCTVFSIFSSSSDGVQVSLQVQQKWSEDPGFRRGPCIATLRPDSWSGRGTLPALLPTLEIDGLSPSQIITRYFS